MTQTDDARGPKRIWAFDYDLQDETGDWKTQRGWSETPPYPMLSTEYIRVDLATQPDPVKVKPLEWEKSHLTPWTDDWHTSPTGYTVRCADENGWKWQGFGAHGYASTPDGAKHDVQCHHNAYVRSALETTPQPDPLADPRVTALVDALQWYAEQTRLCRLIHSGGDSGRNALSSDGGAKARAALAAFNTTDTDGKPT